MSVTVEQTRKLRTLALSLTRGELRRPWSVQTSNSFRRIGTDRGDGDVLCAVTQPSDGHPDLHAPADVLDYIVAAHPRVVIQLLDDVDALEDKLAEAKVLCDQIGVVQVRLEEVAGTVAALGTAVAQLGSDDPDAVATALALVDQLASALRTQGTKGP